MYNLQLLYKSLSDGNRCIRIIHRNELPDPVRKQRPGTSSGRMAGRRPWKKTGWWMCEMWKMRRSLSAAYQDKRRTWESSKRIARLEFYKCANKKLEKLRYVNRTPYCCKTISWHASFSVPFVPFMIRHSLELAALLLRHRSVAETRHKRNDGSLAIVRAICFAKVRLFCFTSSFSHCRAKAFRFRDLWKVRSFGWCAK